MDAQIVGQLGVEGSADDPALANGNDALAISRQDFDPFARLGNNRCPDENGGHRVVDAGKPDRVFEAVNLGPESVPDDRNVEDSQAVLIVALHHSGEEDHAHASAPDRHSLVRAASDLVPESVAPQEETYGCAFTAGDDQAIDPGELFGGSDLKGFDAVSGRSHGLQVLFEVTLHRQDTDPLRHPASVSGLRVTDAAGRRCRDDTPEIGIARLEPREFETEASARLSGITVDKARKTRVEVSQLFDRGQLGMIELVDQLGVPGREPSVGALTQSTASGIDGRGPPTEGAQRKGFKKPISRLRRIVGDEATRGAEDIFVSLEVPLRADGDLPHGYIRGILSEEATTKA